MRLFRNSLVQTLALAASVYALQGCGLEENPVAPQEEPEKMEECWYSVDSPFAADTSLVNLDMPPHVNNAWFRDEYGLDSVTVENGAWTEEQSNMYKQPVIVTPHGSDKAVGEFIAQRPDTLENKMKLLPVGGGFSFELYMGTDPNHPSTAASPDVVNGGLEILAYADRDTLSSRRSTYHSGDFFSSDLQVYDADLPGCNR